MESLYNLDKKGTVILSVGRAGSHLMGDMITEHLKSLNANITNRTEYFFQNRPNTTASYNKLVLELADSTTYNVIQIQDFNNQIRLLRFDSSWLNDYHVVRLTRNDLMAQFFGLQVLRNFYQVVPAHLVKGIRDSFDNLIDQNLTISFDEVYQFLSHCELIKLIPADFEISYEDFIAAEETEISKYQKNKYPITSEQLFNNYTDVLNWLYGND